MTEDRAQPPYPRQKVRRLVGLIGDQRCTRQAATWPVNSEDYRVVGCRKRKSSPLTSGLELRYRWQIAT